MGSKLRHRPNPVKRAEPTVGGTGVRTVCITDEQNAFKLRILNEKWTKTERRTNEQCAQIKQTAETQMRALMAAMQMEHQDFIASCAEVAVPLGIDINDESTTVRYDDVTNCFIVTPKDAAAETAPVQVPEPGPVDDDGDVIEELDAVSAAAEGMDAGQNAEVQP